MQGISPPILLPSRKMQGLVDDVHKIFQFPTEEEDFTAEKKRYHK